MDVFDRYYVFRAQMTSLDAFELDYKLACFERLLDFDVNGATDCVSRIETQNIVVKIDVNGAVKVQVERLVPENACVFSA